MAAGLVARPRVSSHTARYVPTITVAGSAESPPRVVYERTMIKIREITKTYAMGEIEVHALRGVDVEVQDAELVAIMGPSGSGKSTLMNVMGCLDVPTSGSYELDGMEVSQMTEDELAGVRNRKIGFVFQSFNLLPRRTALEQVELPLIYAGVKDRRERVVAALELVGLGDRLYHKPTEMSGGQQQRVAIARALVTNPSLILADEPTGNLDTKASEEIMEAFLKLNQERGITVVFVTHEPDIAAFTRRVIHIRDGQISSDEREGAEEPVGAGRAAGPSGGERGLASRRTARPTPARAGTLDASERSAERERAQRSGPKAKAGRPPRPYRVGEGEGAPPSADPRSLTPIGGVR